MKVTIVGGAHTDADGEPTPNSPLVIVDDHGIHVSALEPASVATATSLAAHCAERGEGSDINRSQNRLRCMTVCWMLPMPNPVGGSTNSGGTRGNGPGLERGSGASSSPQDYAGRTSRRLPSGCAARPASWCAPSA